MLCSGPRPKGARVNTLGPMPEGGLYVDVLGSPEARPCQRIPVPWSLRNLPHGVPMHCAANDSCWSHTRLSDTCLLHHNVFHTTMFVPPQCLLHHNVCYTTMFVTPQCLFHHNVCYTTMFVTQCLLHHNVCYTMFVTPQCLLHHNVCNTTMFVTHVFVTHTAELHALCG